jgi:hypothetical protein
MANKITGVWARRKEKRAQQKTGVQDPDQASGPNPYRPGDLADLIAGLERIEAERKEAEIRLERLKRTREWILEDLRRNGDLHFTLRWHIKREDSHVDNETFRLALESLEREHKITTYWNPQYYWTGYHALTPGNRHRLASPFLDEDRHPLPPNAEWRAGAPLP